MSRAACDVVFVDLRNKGVSAQHRLVRFPEPRGKARRKALFKEPSDAAEVRSAEHRCRKVDPVAQKSKRGLCLRRKDLPDRLRAPILTARRRLLRQLFRRSSAGLCLRHVTGGVVYGFLRFGLPLLRACAERQQQNQCQQQGDRLLAGNSHSRSLPLIPLRRESNLPFLRAAMLFRPRSAGQVNCGAPAAPAAGGKSEKSQAEAYCGERPVHFSAPFFMNSRIAPAPNGAGACFCLASAIPLDMRYEGAVA